MLSMRRTKGAVALAPNRRWRRPSSRRSDLIGHHDGKNILTALVRLSLSSTRFTHARSFSLHRCKAHIADLLIKCAIDFQRRSAPLVLARPRSWMCWRAARPVRLLPQIFDCSSQSPFRNRPVALCLVQDSQLVEAPQHHRFLSSGRRLRLHRASCPQACGRAGERHQRGR